MTALSRAGYQMVNVAHRGRRNGDAGRAQQRQLAPLLSREGRPATPGDAIVRWVRVVETQPTHQ